MRRFFDKWLVDSPLYVLKTGAWSCGGFLTPPLAKYDPFPMVIELKTAFQPLSQIA